MNIIVGNTDARYLFFCAKNVLEIHKGHMFIALALFANSCHARSYKLCH